MKPIVSATIVAPFWKRITTATTLLSGVVVTVLTNIQNFPSCHPVWFSVSLGLFCVSMSVVLFQILEGLTMNTDSIHALCLSKSHVIMPDGFNTIVTGLKKMVKEENGLSLKIICYGTSGYNGVIEDICKNGNRNNNVSALFYNPSSNHFHAPDKRIITAVINKIKKHSNVKIYDSQILPSMRSCVVYRDNNPIWCCIQTYCYRGEFRTAEYDKAPAIFANEKDREILKSMVKLVEVEYKRLGGNNEKNRNKS